MSIMGRVMLECDTKGCHGCEVIEAEDFDGRDIKRSLTVSASFAGWVLDDDGNIRCPMCCEEGRSKGDDDGVEYQDPREAMEDRYAD